MSPQRRIVVVGAGPAGFAACETLRGEGFDGRIDLVGLEPRLPYSRPPLSKKFLTETGVVEPIPGVERLDVHWHLGVGALGLREGEVELDSGRRLPFDGLIAATGARPRGLPGPPPPAGVMALRSASDAERLREALRSRPGRLLVVGAGFVGCEVASSATALGIEVTLVEIEQLPLRQLLGPLVGELLAEIQRENGVDLRLGTSLGELREEEGRLVGAELGDGSRVAASTCLLALGAAPDTDWLDGSGLAGEAGVECDSSLLAEGGGEVAVAGDLARWPHPLFGGERVRVGHWSNALDQGAQAARALLGTEAGRQPFGPVPSFSSSVHGLTLRSLGLPALATGSRLLEGDPAERRFLVAYERRGSLVGILGVNMGGRVNRYREAIGKPL